MKKVFLIITIILIFIYENFGQPINRYINDVAVQNPNVSSFNRYGEIEVGYHTGTANIEVPIVDVNDGPVSIPIGVSYHHGGIKVEDIASKVGLGWNLNIGGSLTRDINGLADDAPNGYYNIASFGTITNDGYWIPQNPVTGDAEPDLFFFQAGKYSGKFIVEVETTPPYAKRVMQFPKQDIKIEYIVGNFKITTPDGTVYEYGGAFDVDKVQSQNGQNGNPTSYNITAWHLSKISSYDKKYSINFVYEDDFYSYKSSANSFETVFGNPCTTNNQGKYSTTLFYTFQNGSTPYYYRYNVSQILGRRIKKIYSKLDTIVFNYQNIREDLDPHFVYSNNKSKRLDEIIVKTGGNSYCKKFAFSYNYLIDNTKSTYVEAKRLNLLSIQESTCAGITPAISIPPYTFTYDNSFLPWRLSRARDHWGYYNGASGNEFLETNVPPTTINFQGQNHSYGQANRTPNSSFLQSKILTKINYPTGGFTEFTYEPHKFTTACLPVPTLQENINASSSVFVDSENMEIKSTFKEIEYAQDITSILIKKNKKSSIKDNQSFINLKILNIDSSVINEISYNFDSNEIRDTFISPNLLELITPSLRKGKKYIFRLDAINTEGEFILTFNNDSNNRNVEWTASGLRIKKIRSYDGRSTANDIFTSYTYSNGWLYFSPVYGAVADRTFSTGDACGGAYVVSSNNLFAPQFSSFIGYGIVNEYFTSDNTISGGYNVYEFMNGCNSTSSNPLFPSLEVFYQKGYGTNELKKDDGNNTIESTYKNFLATNYSYGNNTMRMAAPIGVNIGGQSESAFCYKVYNPTTSFLKLGSVTSTKDAVITTKTFEYGTSHFAPTAEIVINSDGKKYKNSTSYAFDLAATGNVYENMKNLNILEPIEKISYIDVNNSFIPFGGERTTYKMWGTSPNQVPYPEKFDNYEVDYNYTTNTWNTMSTPWVNQATINSYDLTYGKPSSITIAGWSPETYTYTIGGLLSTKTFLSFLTSYAYKPNSRLLSTITDIDGKQQTFNYDGLTRLLNKTEVCKNVIQSFTYNYIGGANSITTTTTLPQVSYSSTTSIINKSYLDGLGREYQTQKVSQGNTSSANSIVTGVDYNQYGEIEFKFLEQEVPNNSNAIDFSSMPWWPKISFSYENNDLRRNISTTLPGFSYSTIQSYGRNNNVIAGYPIGSLNVTNIIDGSGNGTATYTDKLGRTVLQSQGLITTLITQNIYDEKGRILKILPPATTVSHPSIFSYEYYKDDLIKTKKQPDISPTLYIYNDRDLPIQYQDGNLLQSNKYFSYNYDSYGRVTKTGFFGTMFSNGSSSQPSILSTNLLTEKIYGATSFLKNKIIESRNRILNPDGTLGTYLKEFYSYDNCGRVSKIEKNNILNGTDKNEYTILAYDGANNITTSNYYHVINGVTQNFNEINQIDYAGRIDKVLNGLNTTIYQEIADYDYQPSNQNSSIKLGKVSTNTYLQTVNYAYLPNQYLKSIASSSTSGSLYNSVYDFFGNGDISRITTQVRSDDKHRSDYIYDEYSRLKSMSHSFLNNSNVVLSTDKFKETYNYDDRGNISSLKRNGQYKNTSGLYISDEIDNLTYTYASIASQQTNKLSTLVDNANIAVKQYGAKSGGSNLYTYDNNGNVTFDPTNNMLISYNHLNLPYKYANGNKIIEVTYDSEGNLLRRVATENSTVITNKAYVGMTEYESNVFSLVKNSVGRIRKSGSVWKYEYDIKDHLGNTRVTFCDFNNNGVITYSDDNEIKDIQHYFSSGMAQDGIWSDQPTFANTYLYNGKEIVNDFGLNWYNYGARWYDPMIGRFISLDKLADEPEQIDKSPYAYAWNNPIKLNDPDGNCPNCLTALGGALIKGGIELGGQLLSGKSISEVDWVDVGVEAGKGAFIGSGAGLFAIGVAEVSSSVIKASTDYTVKDGVKSVVNGSKDKKEAAVDLVVDVVSGKVGGKIVSKSNSAVTSTSKNLDNSTKALRKAENSYNKVTDGGKNTYGAKATAATQKLRNAAANNQGAAAQNTVAKTTNKVVKSKAGETAGKAAETSIGDLFKSWIGY